MKQYLILNFNYRVTLISDPSDNEECIIPSVTNEKMEMHSAVRFLDYSYFFTK